MFTKKDLLYLADIFTLARLQTVNENPQNKQQLENVLHFESFIVSKINETNNKLGYVEPEEEPTLEAIENKD